ncbi:hypothetical protein COCOR_07071 [Corallococcus coralloides DSM 2259]|uniref:Uncharacterized protein n=1 Tax=Corallococcus coralloides (strain ATCC 25202 / DSM 2259 / NBRC 100086 / M2) TaxID=1144275 RepID=H8MH38_CORCM|nr:hypothetical protein COCOR_07071 [Corallococcus coralloides DSM 2259]
MLPSRGRMRRSHVRALPEPLLALATSRSRLLAQADGRRRVSPLLLPARPGRRCVHRVAAPAPGLLLTRGKTTHRVRRCVLLVRPLLVSTNRGPAVMPLRARPGGKGALRVLTVRRSPNRDPVLLLHPTPLAPHVKACALHVPVPTHSLNQRRGPGCRGGEPPLRVRSCALHVPAAVRSPSPRPESGCRGAEPLLLPARPVKSAAAKRLRSASRALASIPFARRARRITSMWNRSANRRPECRRHRNARPAMQIAT